LARYPENEQAAQAGQAQEKLESMMEQILVDLELPGDNPLSLAVEHDRIRANLEHGEFREARQAAQNFLKHTPNFVPVLNNLSQLDFIEGNFESAIATTHQVLALEPDNFQASGNLTRYLYLTGQQEEARQQAAHLKTIESKFEEAWLKKAETFTYLGDDQRVLETFQAAEQAGALETLASPMLYHFAAVAALRQGDEKRAKKYWQQTLKIDPNFGLARQNLADLKGPVEQRHAPWPFWFQQWISQKARTDLGKYLEPAVKRNKKDALDRAMRRYWQQHPEILHLIPILLERGDPEGREFAVSLASLIQTPELLTALKNFVLSQHGPDALRHQALQTVSTAGLLSEGPVRMWLKGDWQEIFSMNFEIYEEPVEKGYPEEMEPLLTEAMDALYEERLPEAERLFKEALEIVPNDPSLLNNLGLVYDKQGRKKEVEAIIRQVHQENPDYFFGIIGVANLHIRKGETDQAEELLKPLLTQKRLHYSEFAAMCMAHIQLYLKRGLPEGAETWVKMWSDVDPDHPNLVYWKQQLKLHKLKKVGRVDWRKMLGRKRK
jgi:tetratricopeptide (TPR) repeat protein